MEREENKMKQLKFEWYVLNENFNRNHEITPYNIFNNVYVNEKANELCVKYKAQKMSFDNFVEELESAIRWQEWGRCEYEIMVRSLFGNEEQYQKIDCYQQAKPNMRIIAKYVLEEYYPKLKISMDTKELD